MQARKYAWQQILLHWVSALVIIWVLLSGFYVAHLNVTPTTFHLVAFVNVAMTTLFIPIFLLRWLLRRTLFKPGSLEGAARGSGSPILSMKVCTGPPRSCCCPAY
ncbi:hypothetical protein QJS63_06505 [Pseudomonas juntendi]|nr:hypothetical protein QJS63_06505 [Pseudomonas juntendi]